MIRRIDVDKDNNISTNIVDELSEIDLTKDVLIVFKPANFNKTDIEAIEYNVDEFIINSIEDIRPAGHGKTVKFNIFPRIKMTLPNGLFPNFRCLIPGLGIRYDRLEKIQGVELTERLTLGDKIVDIKGVKGLYSAYSEMAIELEQFDHQLFSEDRRFMGHRIPANTQVLGLRLMPHFIGEWSKMDWRNMYMICSSYLHDRFPNL